MLIPENFICEFLQQGGKLRADSDGLLWEIQNEKLKAIADAVLPDSAGAIRSLMRDGDTWLDSTPGQQRFWVEHVMSENKAYLQNPRMVHDICGLPDRQKLNHCLRRLTERHELFRTNFLDLAGYPVQVIRASGEWPLAFYDLRSLTGEELNARLMAITSETLYAPLDIFEGSVFRAALVYLDDLNSRLIIGLHHIVVDGWAFGMMLEELEHLYHSDNPLDTAMPPVTYMQIHYLEHIRQFQQSEKYASDEEYWKTALSGIGEIATLPDIPERFTNAGPGSTILSYEFPNDVWVKVGETAKKFGVTKYRILISAFAFLLQRYSGNGDIIIGTPYACRTSEGMKNFLGMTLNTIPIRLRVEREYSLLEMARQADGAISNAIKHGELPLQEIVRCARAANDDLHQDLFSIIFTHHNYKLSLPKIDGEKLRYNHDHTVRYFNYHSLFEFIEENDRVLWQVSFQNCKYSTGYFSDICAHYLSLLEAALANPDTPFNKLQCRLYDSPLQAQTPHNAYPEDISIVRLFENSVASHRDKTALINGESTMTYGELNARANRIAHFLSAKGVGVEDCVAILLPRGFDAVSSILGILKSGAAYVPIDADFPTGKVNYIVDDTEAKFILCHRGHKDTLGAFTGELIVLEDIAQELNAFPVDDFPCPAAGNNLAYVMYTSGTTGVPKGVCVEHRNITRLVVNTHYVDFSSQHTWLMFSPLAFDASTLELWGSLLHGAALALYPPYMPTLSELGGFIREHRVSSLFLTTSLFNQLADCQLSDFSCVTQCMTGGENMSAEHVAKFMEAHPNIRLLNVYGPTECTTFSTYFVMDPYGVLPLPVPIGVALPHTQCHILDDDLRPLPVGICGELCIGGGGVARGYLGKPELTEEVFVTVQLPNYDAPQRLYRSGDLARLLPDGNIEFLGRRDQQVKIRGFRIELGEIEAALRLHPNINEAVVAAHTADRGDKKLTAFLQLKSGDALDISEVQSHLAHYLAPPMVPRQYTFVKEWPITSSGKIDRITLQKKHTAFTANRTDYVAPVSALEIKLAELWSSLLSIQNIGRHDNFFSLGGHSLLATRLLSGVRNLYGCEPRFYELFKNPTLAEFSNLVSQKLEQDCPANGNGKDNGTLFSKPSNNGTHPPRNQEMSNSDMTTAFGAHNANGTPQFQTRFPMSFAQQRLWVINQIDPGNTSYDMPYFVGLKGELNVPALERALIEIVQRHEVLRTTFGLHEGQPVQRVSAKNTFSVEKVTQEENHGASREEIELQWVKLILEKPFNLETGPLFRCRLVAMEKDYHLLLICMHHIISDGWSLGVLVNELSALYADYVAGRESKLPPLKIQYADFTLWQHEYLQGGARERQLNYWMEKLKDLEPSEIAPNKPRPPVLQYDAYGLKMPMPQYLSEKLNRFCNDRNVTVFMAVLAAFFALQHRYTGQSDLSVGSPIANRNRQEIENIIGFFVNTLVMRAQISEGMTFEELLRKVRDTALDAYDHQDLPFEYLVEKLNPVRDPSRNPLFQIMLAVQNLPLGDCDLHGLTVEMLPSTTCSTRFDIEIHIWPDPNGYHCIMYYNTSLFEHAFVEQLWRHWFAILDNAIDSPNKTLGELEYLDKNELNELVHANTPNLNPYPKEDSIPALFSKVAEKYGDAPALLSPYKSFSYRELDALSNRFAHLLNARGVGLEDRVALLMRRGPYAVAAILGILKAGAAYVPIDADFPASRIAFMLEETSAKSVILEPNIGVELDGKINNVLKLEEIANELEAMPDTAFPCPAKGENLAYIMYTSGSTGTPKGVCVEHRNISRLVLNTDYLDFSQKHTWLMFSPLAFDASTLEIWASLLHGAKLAIYPSFLPSLAELANFITESKISALWLTGSLFNQMVDQHINCFSGVAQCVTGGEAMSAEHARKFLDKFPDKSLHNGYGPTECTTFASTYRLDASKPIPDNIPIGTALPNSACHILDQYRHVLPPGVIGELYIAGGGVARGYLDSPELTQERFVTLHLPGAPEPVRAYKSGDLARRLPDGNIEFCGRRDHQVKMRGFRIELGEIEAALRAHPDIAEAVVLLQESNGNKRLDAYVTLDDAYQSKNGDAEIKQVDHWRSLYEETYAPDTDKSATPDNFIGWNSSYTGEPIPEAEMREWAEATARQLRARGAKRVLELGCGTGLLIARIAPGTDAYVGVDFSEEGLRHARALTQSRPELAHVRLHHGRVDDLAFLNGETFDLIVLNSVVQYFPSVDYLRGVLQNALALLAPGGAIYLGDLRALPLHEHYAFSVQLRQAKAETPLAAAMDAARRNVQREEELLIAPEFFHAFQQENPAIAEVRIAPKEGAHHNELTRFRYEALLDTHPVENPAPVEWLHWDALPQGLQSLGETLGQNAGRGIAVRGVPNARLALENFAMRRLEEADANTLGAGDVRAQTPPPGVGPDALRALAQDRGLNVFVDWSDMADEGKLNAVFYPAGTGMSLSAPGAAKVRRPWRTYANNPLQAIFARQIVPNLRQHLLAQLPEYMVPANYAVIEKFPLNKNGKTDRNAVSRLAAAFNKRSEEYAAPQGETQKFLAACFEELLGISNVGAHDNFFELGGHSLLATQLVSRIQETLGKAMPLRLFFDEPTVAAFAPKVDAAPASAQGENHAAPIAKRAKSREELLMEKLSTLSEDELENILGKLKG